MPIVGSAGSRRAKTIDKQFGWFWRHLLRLNAQFAAVVTAGQSLTDRLIEGGMSHVVTNPMGVADTVFSPALRDDALRARLLQRCELPESATLLIGAGRHAPEKRWPMVIEAVTAAGIDAPVGLALIGDGRETSKIIRTAQGNPHIRLLSPIADRLELARLFASSDALIHGCEAETFCMVAAEARASGLPLIVPDGGGAADQARLSDGWTYAAGEAASAASAVGDFIAADRAAVRSRAVADAAHVRTMDEHFADLFALYRSLTSSNRIAA